MFYGIVLVQLACCSFRCRPTLSLCWKCVYLHSVTAARTELKETKTDKQTHRQTNQVRRQSRELPKFICSYIMSLHFRMDIFDASHEEWPERTWLGDHLARHSLCLDGWNDHEEVYTRGTNIIICIWIEHLDRNKGDNVIAYSERRKLRPVNYLATECVNILIELCPTIDKTWHSTIWL